MNNLYKVFSVVAGLFLSIGVFGQTCISSAQETSPSSIWENLGNGEIRDTQSGLIWQRCAVGQTFTDGACTGEAMRMTWQQALVFAHEAAHTARTGWRLPNIKELATITERLCVRPAINTEVFPNTPSDDFWSATPSVEDPLRAWVVAFFNSSHSIKQKDRFIYVRLVRQ